MKKTVKLKVSEIKETFVVRLHLNQAHVEYLVDLITAGVTLPPLILSDAGNELVDGRHRLAAYRAMEFKDVECEFQHFSSRAEMIVRALKCNVGGALPPSSTDIGHVMGLLLTAGETRAMIIHNVGEQVGFPARLIRNYLDEVQSAQGKARLKLAIKAVLEESMSVPQAADRFGVKAESITEAMTGKVDKVSAKSGSIGQLKSRLGAQFAKTGAVVGHNLQHVARDLTDGVIQPPDVKKVMDHYGKLIARQNQRYDEWCKRFNLHATAAEEGVVVSVKRARKPAVNAGKKALSAMGLVQ